MTSKTYLVTQEIQAGKNDIPREQTSNSIEEKDNEEKYNEEKVEKKTKKTKKKKKKTIPFVNPYTQIKTFTQKYKDSANEYFNQTTAFTQFPKHLFAYITAPIIASTPQAETKAKAKIQERINKINAQSVKAPWGEYRYMSLADQEQYFK